ncbi:mandelate racemase/muconate lactonizing enzyme family protein [Symmachiella dynata]|mgnify:CR=1 FL=1|uniref:mandelate racemase/muconate lactonizing enzyme family protein n=1 Tax=Symmachiella dynata TaxID=2527995 RepID=UPI0030ECF2C2
MPHSVKSIETIWVDLPLRPVPARNMVREIPHWTLFEICIVTLDCGIVGFGETMVYYTWGESTVTDAAKNQVIGKHPAENMWDDSLGAGLQIALFDAAAKVLDAPLHQMLGQQVRDRCHLSWWDIDLPAADWISECELAISQGYTAFKSKGRPWWDIIEQTRQLCATLPDHFEVDMDFNGFGIDAAHCTRLLKEMEQFHHVVMFESPLPHHDVAGYKHLRQHTHVPLSMHTQTHIGDPSLEVAIREEMVDGFVLCGGATKIQREAHLCGQFNKSFFLQVVGTKIAAAFGLHLGAVLENARWPAVNCHQLFERDCVQQSIPVSNGLATVPNEPGLGIDLDEEAIELFRTEPRDKPYPHPELLIAIRWPAGTTTYYAHTAQFWEDWHAGRLPFFPRGVNLEHIANDGTASWKDLRSRALAGAVHSQSPPF